MPHHANLSALIRDCHSFDWSRIEPRRNLHLAAWQEDWDDNLAMLEAFVEDGSDQLESIADGAAGWENAVQVASTLLRQAIDRGLPAQALRPLYLEVVALWRDYAGLLQEASQPAPIDTSTDGYQFALQLLTLAVLLDAQEVIPAICEELLLGPTDRLLDYLSAAAMDMQEAREDCLHPDPFSGLNEFFEQYGEVHALPLQAYLEQHYTRFFALSPKEQKTQTRLTGPQAWGWWGFEVGALVVLYELDDSLLREHPHYPADLVDYALGVPD